MKRILGILALAVSLHAAGTVQQSFSQIGTSGSYALQVNWTGDASNGTVPATAAVLGSIVQGYRVISVSVAPGSPAPSNNYSLTLTDFSGVDILAGSGAGLSSTTPSSISASPSAPPIYGTLNINITATSVVNAKGLIMVYLAPLSQVYGLTPTAPSFSSQGPNLFLASPNGSSGAPNFRAIVAADVPLIPLTTGVSGILPVANGGTASATAGAARTALAVPGLADANAFTNTESHSSTETYTGGVQMGGASSTRVNRTSTGSPVARDNCAAIGETYFQSDASAGSNLWSCTATGTPGTWTLIGANSLPSAAGRPFYVRTNPNAANNTTFEAQPIFGSQTAVATDYNFTAQTPGGTLTVGAQTITLTPCPLGVAGSSTSLSLYISGGAGAGSAEAVPITGGTCTSGAATGTVIVTVAACGGGNCHTGAWTISSASGGIGEAAVVAGSQGQVIIPAGVYHLKGTVNFPTGQSILGAGSFAVTIIQDFAAGDAFVVNNIGLSPAGSVVRGLTFNPSVVISSGWCLKYIGGDGTVDDVYMWGGTGGHTLANGLMLDDTTRVKVSNININAWTGTGIQVGGPNGASGPVITNLQASSTNTNAKCVEVINGEMELSNFVCQTIGSNTVGISLNPTNPAVVNPVQVSNGIIDSANSGILRAGTGTVSSLLFSNLYIDKGAGGFAASLATITGVQFSNVEVYGYGTNGGATLSFTSIKNLIINGLTMADTLAINTNDILVNNCINVSITNSQIGIVSSTGQPDSTVNINYAIGLFGTTDQVTLQGNALAGTFPVYDNASTANAIINISGNRGVDDVRPTVASAGTVSFQNQQVNPVLFVSGTTTILTINGASAGTLWNGRTITLIKADAGSLTVGGGGNIPGTHTMAQYARLSLTYDSGTTSWY